MCNSFMSTKWQHAICFNENNFMNIDSVWQLWQNWTAAGFSMSNHIYLELITRIVLRWKYDQTVLKHNSLREARMKNNKWQNVDGGLVRTFHSSSRRNICSLYLMPISYFAKLSSLIQFSPFPAYHLIELIFLIRDILGLKTVNCRLW